MHSTEHHRKLNSSEAAEYLGISVNTLSKRRVDGDRPVRAKIEDFCGRSSDAGATLARCPNAGSTSTARNGEHL
jgi:hypothetical protein